MLVISPGWPMRKNGGISRKVRYTSFAYIKSTSNAPLRNYLETVQAGPLAIHRLALQEGDNRAWVSSPRSEASGPLPMGTSSIAPGLVSGAKGERLSQTQSLFRLVYGS